MTKICFADGCDRGAVARGLCLKHWKRARRRGFAPEPTPDRSGWTEANIAWVAGVIEGEGNIDFGRKRRLGRIRVRMTDLDVLERLLAITKVGKIYGPYKRKNPKYKDAWEWVVGRKREVVELTEAILPWLCSRRREKAMAMLSNIKSNKRWMKNAS